jgi:two-component system response regulator
MTAPLPRGPAAPLSSPAAPLTTILLVEHNPLEVELTLRPLRELGGNTRVEVARDGEEALDFLLGRGEFRQRLPRPLPQLVLLALQLPKMDGMDVLRGIRGNARTCMVPVVVLTSAGDPRQLAQCYQLGANSCVLRPVRYEQFSQAIQSIARYWLDSNLAPPPSAQPPV